MISEHVGAWLQQQGLGTLGVDLFIDNLPETPDEAMVVFSSGGQSPTWVHDHAGVETELPTFQVVARSRIIGTAKARINATYTALQRIRNEPVDGARFLRVVPLQTPFVFERDANDRWRFGVNFIAEKESG